MTSTPDPVQDLRAALAHSPDNIPLHLLLARALLDQGRSNEAETEFRLLMGKAPDAEIALGLARAFAAQGKISAAVVLLEEWSGRPNCPATLKVKLADYYLRSGEAAQAVAIYRQALQQDPNCRSEELSVRLGVDLDPETEAQSELVDGRLRLVPEADYQPPLEVQKSDIDFSDIGGMDAVKQEIRMKIILPMERPDLFEAYGKKTGGGILLYGPPGCGKTLMAKATAGEVRARFIAIGIHDVLDMWIGSSEKNLHGIFESARSQTPTVLFFDEVDALGASRTDMRQSSGRHLVNQFLAELDGMEHDNDGLLILGATNAPWHLDPAFRRPGRFDRILFVPPPDEAARAEILRALLKNKPVDDIDAEKVARKTQDFSGADLQGVVDVAIELRLNEALRSGTTAPITTKDLLKAAKGVRPSTKEWFGTARNYALYSNQGGIYDDILDFLKIKP
jgi:SpoVK/Ycf46/Vps4 family AAA+-type ATPase